MIAIALFSLAEMNAKPDEIKHPPSLKTDIALKFAKHEVQVLLEQDYPHFHTLIHLFSVFCSRLTIEELVEYRAFSSKLPW
jgi:hypothetical protein